MAKESTIQHYTSSITGNTPSAVDLASGELAINIADEKVFLKNLLGNVVSLSQSKDLSGAFASKATVVTSFNGLTGAVSYSPAFASSSVTGVASFNSTYFAVGATGVVTLASAYQVTGDTIAAGTGISVSRSGNTSTITNTGVQSIDGATGGITNVARTNVDNLFSISQTVYGNIHAYDLGTDRQITLNPNANKITFTNNYNGNDLQLYCGNFGNQLITLPIESTTLAGLACTQTFTATNTFSALQNFTLGISASGATFSGNISARNIVTSFNGATGAVTGASLGANTFTALNSFNAGISASALTVSGTITSTEGITFGSGTTFMAFVPKTAINGGGLWLRDGLFQVGGGVFAANNGNLQYNMNSERFFVYGHQIIDNAAPYQDTTTPLTVKGGTGQSVPLFNVTRGGTSAVQVHQDGYLAIPVNTSPAIKIGNHDTKNLTLASIDASGEIVQTGAANSSLNIRQESGGPVFIGDYAGTNNNTHIEVNDVASTIVLNAGEIYLNGGISTPLVLGSAESIQNTTNGRIDFMPGPTAAGAYGLYADLTNWGYGVQMGTINSAGTIDSSPGGILFMDAVTIVQDKFLNLGSDGSHALVLATQNGLDTLQIAVSPGAANSNAVAIAGRSDAGTVNRSPVTSHTNPNLYIYRAGTTSANDFIRIEHNGTNGNIVAGGTSGIKISGLLDVASGLSAAGATFSGDITVNSMTVGRGGGGDYRNTAVGKDALLQNTGIGNAGMGTYALGANTSGSNKTAIGYAAGYYRGSGVSTLTTGTGGIYIGYQARGSALAQTNEIVIGADALGLGSNTAVIGATTQSAATVYGVLNLPSGLSAAGATFGGTVNHQDNTLSRVELLDYFERYSDLGDFATKGEQIPINLTTAQVFRTKLTVTCTGLNVTNTPDNGNANAVGFSLLFVGDGTARTMTWNIGNTAASWAGGVAPTYTSTNNKTDVFSFLSRDGGSTWLGFVGGQNF